MDLVIKDGTIIDGTDRAAFRADIGIQGDRIVRIGKLTEPAPDVINASGLVVSPGFIDMHAHSDFALITDPTAKEKIMQGVTTQVIGNCGNAAAPVNEQVREYFRTFLKYVFGEVEAEEWNSLGEYFERLEQNGISINVISHAAHGIIRLIAMGGANRPPTTDEMHQMKQLVRQCMEEGAFGLSTGLIYPPGSFAQKDELIELCRIVSEYDGMYASHIRNEGAGLENSVTEAIEIGRRAGVPVQIAHHKASGKSNWGKVERSLSLIEEAQGSGLDVTADQYPYTASSTVLGAVAAVEREVGDVEDEIQDVLIASTKYDHSLEGRTLRDISAERGKDLRQTVSELLEAEDGAVMVVIFGMSEDDVVTVMKHPSTMIGSDGIEMKRGKPHPRVYGTFPRILGRYVRERSVLSLEEAVRKMTSLTASKLGLKDRGILKEGYYADITVFDPTTVIDRATYTEPHQFAEGIVHVLVNGTPVVHQGKHTGTLKGRVLRKGVD